MQQYLHTEIFVSLVKYQCVYSENEIDHYIVRKLHFTFNVKQKLKLPYVKFEVSTALTMKNSVFWDIKHCSYLRGDTLRLRYRAQPVNAM
jgi:hypothetical protein